MAAIAAAADARRLEEAYWLAVAAGAANTRCAQDHEIGHGPLRLLTLSTLRLPDLALQSYLLDVGRRADVAGLEFELDTAWEITAGALRLAHRALEAHAETLGYEPAAWVDHALARTRVTLGGLESAGIEGAIASRRAKFTGRQSRSRARRPPQSTTPCACPTRSPTRSRTCSRCS